MTVDIVSFIHARLDEDEQVALAARRESETQGETEWYRSGNDGIYIHNTNNSILCGSYEYLNDAIGDHVVRWQPARVLRGVEAKRRLLDEIFGYEATIDGEWGCAHEAEQIAAGRCDDTGRIVALRLIASEWADHADYRQEWTP